MSGVAILESRRQDERPADFLARFDAAAERHATPCGDGEMVWHVFGEGPPLALLHGGFGRWSHWIRNIPELARHFRLYLPDIPAHGDSAMPPEPVSGPSIAGVIAEGLDRLLPTEARYHVAGFSLGGIIGGCLAAREGARVETMTICGSNGLGLRRATLSGLRHWKGVTDPDEIAAVHRNNLGVVMFGDPENIDDVAVYVQSVNTPDARLKSRLIAVTNILAERLPNITARLSGIWGARDCYAAIYMAEREALLRSVQPDCDFRVIDGAGHWVMYEQPAAFNAALLDILGVKGS